MSGSLKKVLLMARLLVYYCFEVAFLYPFVGVQV